MVRNNTFTVDRNELGDWKLVKETGKMFEHNDSYLKTFLYYHIVPKMISSIKGKSN